MDLYAKAESERLAKAEQNKRRQLRITQVRQQADDWMSRSREDYKAEKDRQLKRLSESATSEVQAQAVTCIKYHTEAHSLAMSEIGAAHRAAANLPDFKSLMAKQKQLDDEIAHRRFAVAVKQKRSAEVCKDTKNKESVRRKAQVRFEEDVKARELVEKLPFGVRNTVSEFSKESTRKQKSEYQQSLAKSLYIPATVSDKENKSVPKRITRGKRPAPVKAVGTFAKIADERGRGATTPDLASTHIISSRDIQSVKPKCQTTLPDVTYYDARNPHPPQKYRPPPGLVEPVPRKLSGPTAWSGAKQVDSELLKAKLRKSLDAMERQKIAEKRGQTALKIAKLEREYQQLEVELTQGKEFYGLRPILDSPEKFSVLGLDNSMDSRIQENLIHSLTSDSDKVDEPRPSVSVIEHRDIEIETDDSSVRPEFLSNEEFNRRLENIISGSAVKRRPELQTIPEPAVVLLEDPQCVTPDDHEILEIENSPMSLPKVDVSPVSVVTFRQPKSPFTIPVLEPGLSSDYSSYTDSSDRCPGLGSDCRNIDSTTSSTGSVRSSEKLNKEKKPGVLDSNSSVETKSTPPQSNLTASSYISPSNGRASSSNRRSRIDILLSEISSLSSSPGVQSSGTDYFGPPDKTTGKVSTPGPVTSTPESHVSKTSVSRTLTFKHYMAKLLARCPDSIDSLTSVSSSNSYILLNTSATISSLSATPSSTSKSRSNTSSSHNGSPTLSHDNIANLSCSFISSTQQTSQIVIQQDTTTTDTNTTMTESSSSMDAIITIQLSPSKLMSSVTDSSTTTTDESLAGALSALCVRQENVLDVIGSGVEVLEDSGSAKYYSADEQNQSSVSDNSAGLFRPKSFHASGEPNPYSSQISGSGDLGSKESYRAAREPSTTIISRPSPDMEMSMENNPFQQLTIEWANISIERPPWL